MEIEEFNDWYKKQFNELNEVPPKEVWNSIANRMDVNDVWKGVDSKLTSFVTRKKITKRISYSLLLLLFTVGIGALLSHSYNKKNKKITSYDRQYSFDKTNKISAHDQVSKNAHSYYTHEEKTQNILNKSSFPIAEKSTLFSVRENLNTKFQNSHSAINSKSSEIISNRNDKDALPENDVFSVSKNNKREESQELLSSNYLQSDSKNYQISIDSMVYILPLSIVLNANPLSYPTITDTITFNYVTNNTSTFAGIYFGGIYSYKNTWLLNNTILNGLSSNSLDQTNLHFGYAYGISAGYYLNPKLSTELNWYINSQQGQTYHTYNEGRYIEKKIKLNFMMFNVSFKRSIPSLITQKNIQTSHNLIAGVNFGLLKKENVEQGLSADEDYSHYSTYDYGLRLGYEYDILLYKRILLAPALTADFGLKNIYKGDTYTPSSFNRTHTASIGLNIGLKYLLSYK